MNALGMRLPIQVNMVKGDKSRNLYRMAYNYCPQRVKVLPRNHRNAKRTFKPVKENVRSTKTKPNPLEEADTNMLCGHKIRDVYTKVYDVRNTVFSDQTGKFPTR